MSDIQEIEITIEHAKKMVERRDAARKLASNREFRKLVMEGYFIDEAARLASISADPLMKSSRDEIILSIQGISTFKQFLQNIIRMGDVAANELREHEEALEELRAVEGEAA